MGENVNIFEVLKVDKNLFEHLHYWGKSHSYHFYFSPDCKNPEEFVRILTDPASPRDMVFPTRRRRKVFVTHTPNCQDILCKQFLLWRHKKECFSVKEFACKEVINRYNFSSCPYHLPEVYGYYERRILGLPVESGLFMSYLRDFEILAPEYYHCVPSVIMSLYERGLFHGDLHIKNLLRQKESGEFALIDFDSMKTVPANSLHHLVLMAGNFLYLTHFLKPETIDQQFRQEFIAALYAELTAAKPGICKFEDFQAIILEISKYQAWKPIPQEVFDKAPAVFGA